MRVVVTGATGNIGTSVLSSLAREPQVTSIVGAARRRPDVKGPFNLAAEPVLDPEVLGRALGKPVVDVPAVVLRHLFALSYHLRLEPADPGWLELALNVPIMSIERARRELGWAPAYGSLAALGELLTGLRQGAGGPTLPLAAAGSREARLLHH